MNLSYAEPEASNVLAPSAPPSGLCPLEFISHPPRCASERHGRNGTRRRNAAGCNPSMIRAHSRVEDCLKPDHEGTGRRASGMPPPHRAACPRPVRPFSRRERSEGGIHARSAPPAGEGPSARNAHSEAARALPKNSTSSSPRSSTGPQLVLQGGVGHLPTPQQQPIRIENDLAGRRWLVVHIRDYAGTAQTKIIGANRYSPPENGGSPALRSMSAPRSRNSIALYAPSSSPSLIALNTRRCSGMGSVQRFPR